MKKLAIAAAVLVSLIALGIAAVPFTQDYAARRLKLELERDGSVRVGTVDVDLFRRAVELVDVTVGFNDEYIILLHLFDLLLCSIQRMRTALT